MKGLDRSECLMQSYDTTGEFGHKEACTSRTRRAQEWNPVGLPTA